MERCPDETETELLGVSQTALIVSVHSRVACQHLHLLPHHNPANTKYLYDICTMLNQRRRRWDDVVQHVMHMFCVY